MPFGRRRDEISTARALHRSSELVSPPEATRLTEFRDHLIGLMDSTVKIADAIREEGTIPDMPVVVDEVEADAGPLRTKGLQERFCIGKGRALRHAVYVFAPQNGQGEVDLSAQDHLQSLFGTILAFNRYCQRAHLDEALGVALQSPHVPEVVDRILLRSAFFAAFFENLAIAESAISTGKPAPRASDELKGVEKRLMMANDKLLVPSHAKILPRIAPPEPYVAGEIMMEPHRGDYFVNGVYVPASLAEQLLGKSSPTLRREALQAVA